MGASLSLDAPPMELAELLAFSPSGPAPARIASPSNLKVWRFFVQKEPIDVGCAAVLPTSFVSGVSARECYVLLHIYRRCKKSAGSRSPAARSPLNRSAASAPPQACCAPGSVASFAQTSRRALTPRGVSSPFSAYADCGLAPFSEGMLPESDGASAPLAHDIYIWNGKEAREVTKAVALTQCFELERYLLADAEGAVRHLYCGAGATQLAAADEVGDDDGQAVSGNHLLELLLSQRHAQAATAIEPNAACRTLEAATVGDHNLPLGATPTSEEPADATRVSSAPVGFRRRATADSASAASASAASAPVAAGEPVAECALPSSRRPRLTWPRQGGILSNGAARAASRRTGKRRTGKGRLSGPPLPKLDLDQVDKMPREPDERESRAAKLARFDRECSKIDDAIFLGSDTVARDVGMLSDAGITHVLNTAGVTLRSYHEGFFEYKTLFLYDSPSQDISLSIYSAVCFMDDALRSGGKVFVHCHQGVSRSSSMVTAYLMWSRRMRFDDAFALVKSRRGVANPNAGFTAKLMEFDQRLHGNVAAGKRLYRMAPWYLEPVPTKIELEPSYAQLDARAVFVLLAQEHAYVWVGGHSASEYQIASHKFVAQVQRVERVELEVHEEAQGEESASFWNALGGEGPVATRLHAYDGDYGVGKAPLLKVAVRAPLLDPPATEPRLPAPVPLPAPRSCEPPGPGQVSTAPAQAPSASQHSTPRPPTSSLSPTFPSFLSSSSPRPPSRRCQAPLLCRSGFVQ